MKTHLNLRTSDLEKSVAFYRTLLDSEPVKQYHDYALFVTEQPGIELALDRNPGVSVAESAHYGIVVDSEGDVEAAVTRLDRAGLVEEIEHEENCCYAKQTKVWARDPDGRRWEVYTVLEETAQRGETACDCCAAG